MRKSTDRDRHRPRHPRPLLSPTPMASTNLGDRGERLKPPEVGRPDLLLAREEQGGGCRASVTPT
jgi:hypothetical protein